MNNKLKPSRAVNRVFIEKKLVKEVLDMSSVCTISLIINGEPRALPTGFVRINHDIYIHGAIKSHFMLALLKESTVCITSFILDGIVLAKSGLKHSFNYRSVVIYSKPKEVVSAEEKNEILARFTDKYVPNRWNDIKTPSLEELNATCIIKFNIDESSVKIRKGPPNDNEGDLELDIWSGVINLKNTISHIEPHVSSTNMKLPDYLISLLDNDSMD